MNIAITFQRELDPVDEARTHLGRIQSTAAVLAHYGSPAATRRWGRVASSLLTIARVCGFELKGEAIVAHATDAAKVASVLLEQAAPMLPKRDDEPEAMAAVSALVALVRVELDALARGV